IEFGKRSGFANVPRKNAPCGKRKADRDRDREKGAEQPSPVPQKLPILSPFSAPPPPSPIPPDHHLSFNPIASQNPRQNPSFPHLPSIPPPPSPPRLTGRIQRVASEAAAAAAAAAAEVGVLYEPRAAAAAAATGSVSWVAAQPSVLGRCGGGGGGGGAPCGPARGGVGGGGRGVRAVGVVRCCARVQEKRPPRGRKTKEERRELVESFINNYRLSNNGKFPSVNLTHKEVGGSYYIVREIVRDIIQENKVLGPGGLNATTLSFEDCPDSSELSIEHELGQDSTEILHTSDDIQVGKDGSSEMSNREESYSLQNNVINTQTLLESSNLLEAGVLNSAVQDGSAGGASLETSLEKQDMVPSVGSVGVDLNISEEQGPQFAHVSDSDKEVELESLGHIDEGTETSATNGVILSPEPSVYEVNGALLGEHETLPDDSHNGTTDGGVNEESLLGKTNGVLHTEQTTLQEHEALTESVSSDSKMAANPMYGFTSKTNSPESEVTTKTIEPSNEHKLQENSESPVSHPVLDTQGLLEMEGKHNALQVDENEFKKSTPEITTEEVEATSDFSHGEGTSTTTTISRHALCLLTLRCMLTVYNFLHTSQTRTSKAQQKKEENLFWLVLRAFVIASSQDINVETSPIGYLLVSLNKLLVSPSIATLSWSMRSSIIRGINSAFA
ncbi:hypothetical protein EJB05_01350, partial [Eragrostis curvula]